MGTIVRHDLHLSSSTGHPYEKVKAFTQVAKQANVNSSRFKDFRANFSVAIYQFRRPGICSSVKEVELHFAQVSALRV
jgi:hypothetical protein